MSDEPLGFDIHHPALRLRIAADPGRFDPLAPMLLTAAVEIAVPHGTGRFAYSATDVAFLDEGVERFIGELAALAREGRGQARLSAVADALWIEVGEKGSGFSISVGAEEPSVGGGHGLLRCGAPVPSEVVIELDRGVRQVAEAHRRWQEEAA